VGREGPLPGVCSIYVDVRMPPQVRPVAIQRGLEQALNATGVDFEMDAYKSLLGHEGKDVEPLVKCAEEVNRHLFGENIKPESPDRASIWTDTNIYNELTIPAIKIGPRRPAHQRAQRGDRHRCHGQGSANLRADGA
jgi:acetylornithine deacetylase/succinyl-diaminopimelate desuccinylase-like protein